MSTLTKIRNPNIEFRFDKGRCIFNRLAEDPNYNGKRGVNYFRICNCLGLILEKLGFVYRIHGFHEGKSRIVWVNKVSFDKWKERHKNDNPDIDQAKLKTATPTQAIELISRNNKYAILSYVQVMELAHKEFAGYPLKDGIIKRIETRLAENEYQKQIEKGNNIVITETREDYPGKRLVVPVPDDHQIIRSAALFIRYLPGVHVTVKLPSLSQVMQDANKEFSSHPQKDAILKRIEGRLIDNKYQECIDNCVNPHFYETWGDSLWGQVPGELTKDEEEVIKCATGFITELPGMHVTVEK